MSVDIAGAERTLEKLKYIELKATVLAESSIHFFFSPGSLHSSDVYRLKSGKSLTLPFF